VHARTLGPTQSSLCAGHRHHSATRAASIASVIVQCVRRSELRDLWAGPCSLKQAVHTGDIRGGRELADQNSHPRAHLQDKKLHFNANATLTRRWNGGWAGYFVGVRLE